MSSESNISWETLKDVAVTLDSYRIRALIDAKQEILDAGIYSEEQYFKLLFKMFDEEHLKYRLFNYLNQHNSNNFDSIKQFSKKNSLDVRKTLSLLELLKNENLVVVKKITETKIRRFLFEKGVMKTPKLLFFRSSCRKSALYSCRERHPYPDLSADWRRPILWQQKYSFLCICSIHF